MSKAPPVISRLVPKSPVSQRRRSLECSVRRVPSVNRGKCTIVDSDPSRFPPPQGAHRHQPLAGHGRRAPPRQFPARGRQCEGPFPQPAVCSGSPFPSCVFEDCHDGVLGVDESPSAHVRDAFALLCRVEAWSTATEAPAASSRCAGMPAGTKWAPVRPTAL